MARQVYSFENSEVSLEIRRAGDDREGFWLIQKKPDVLVPEGLSTRGLLFWFPTEHAALDAINYGHCHRAWDGAKFRDLGVPEKLSNWAVSESELGAFET